MSDLKYLIFCCHSIANGYTDYSASILNCQEFSIKYDTYCMYTYKLKLCIINLYFKSRWIILNIIEVFGTNVRKYRMQLGLSQEKLAEKCNLHRTYISDIECFRRSISLDNIQKIADALGIETYLLFCDKTNKK